MKLCLHCGEELENRRKNYHDQCREPAKTAARLAVRKCKRCKKVKSPNSFVNDESRPDGKFPWCKECQSESNHERRFQDPSDELNGFICPLDDTPIRGHRNRRFCSTSCKDRAASLRKNFGLEVDQYRLLVESTGGRCPLCLNRVHTWHVDHNHRTRKVAGVVCAACNVGPLAYSYHDVEFVRRLLAFLELTPAERLGIQAMAPESYNKPSQLHRTWGNKPRKARA
jgi:hypothetical protein